MLCCISRIISADSQILACLILPIRTIHHIVKDCYLPIQNHYRGDRRTIITQRSSSHFRSFTQTGNFHDFPATVISLPAGWKNYPVLYAGHFKSGVKLQ